jgi:hypothetical protein
VHLVGFTTEIYIRMHGPKSLKKKFHEHCMVTKYWCNEHRTQNPDQNIHVIFLIFLILYGIFNR